MDPELHRLVCNDTPKLNPLICNGLAVEHMKFVEKYVDQIFRSAAAGFPPGLTYSGFARCTPHEEYAMVTRKKGTRQTFDTARSDLYMVKYFFKFNGKDLDPRYLYLPFVSDAGCITISGSRFNISPILSDRVISVGVSNIFIRLLRDKLTFERMGQHFMIDSKRETVQVAWAAIYHKNPKMRKLKPTVKANCTLIHYLFCKYGFTDTFMKFGKCKPIVGGAEINKNTYPDDEWVICTSTQVKPKGVGRSFYEPTTLRLAVRKEDMTPMVKNMIGGFFYIADHFPSHILPEYVDTKRVWMILLGHIIFSGNIGVGKLYSDIEDHITSLDEYIDGIVILKLKEIGVHVDDIYHLFAIVIEKFNDWLLSATDKVASMYDKELSILYFILYEISSAIFNLYFKLKAASKKELTEKEITSTMNMTLRTGLIYSIVKNHGEVSTVSSSGDNKAFKITSLLVPQSSSNRINSRKGPAPLNNPAKRLHVSVAEVGNAFNIPKSEPSGRSRINQMVQVASNGVILRDEKFVELLDDVQQHIKR